MASEPSTIGTYVLPPESRAFRPIGIVANRAVPQISPWLPVSAAIAALRSATTGEGLVVDGDGTPLGVVTLLLLQAAAPGSDVERVMRPLAVILHESVPISIAAKLMSTLPTDRIAVVGDERRALGLLSLDELLRWVAAEAVRNGRRDT